MVHVHTEEECLMVAVEDVQKYRQEVLGTCALLKSTDVDSLPQLKVDEGMNFRSLAFEVVAFALELGLAASFLQTVPTLQAISQLL